MTYAPLASLLVLFFAPWAAAQGINLGPLNPLNPPNPLNPLNPTGPGGILGQTPAGKKQKKKIDKAFDATAQSAHDALGKPVEEVKKASGNYIRTWQKAGEDTEKTIHKAAEDSFATYTKALNDGAREYTKAFDEGIEAGRAAGKFSERQLKDAGNNRKKLERRFREGKYADAMWHWHTDNASSTEKNFFKATQESKLINQAASSAAALYGGPGGAAAYAAWSTYRSTGDSNLAFRAGFLAAATSQAGAYTDKMPTGTMGEVVKKAAMAGAAGGIAVAASGGDEEAIKKGFLQAGGAVLIQGSKDVAKGYSTTANDAIQTYDCVSAKDVDCFSKTTYAKKGAKILKDEYGKPLTESSAGQAAAGAWRSFNKATEEGKRLADIARISKLPGKEVIPVMDNKFVMTWRFSDGQAVSNSAPSVVLTQVAQKPPFRYKVQYTSSEARALAAMGPKAAASAAKAKPKGPTSAATTAVYVCPTKSGFNRTITVTPFGEGCEAIYKRADEDEIIVWRTDLRMKRGACIPKARDYAAGLKKKGLTCRQTK